MSHGNETFSARVEGGAAGADVEGLLRSFFRAELPEPWPALQPPAVGGDAPAPLPFPALSRGRAALAASVAILLVGQLWLSGSYKPPEVSEVRPVSRGVDVASPHVPPRKAPTAGQSGAGGAVSTRPVLKNMR